MAIVYSSLGYRRAVPSLLCLCVLFYSLRCRAQGSGALGSGLSAEAVARGGTMVAASDGPLDAMEGNPAALSFGGKRSVEGGAVGLFALGDFSNTANLDASLHGLAGAMPYGAFATPVRHDSAAHWTLGLAVTPEMLMRANWHYVDAAGTAGVSYGYQRQESQIIAIRSAAGVARSFGSRWSAGVTLGIVYDQNDLHGPYIFQQQAQLAGLKVLLDLTTRGYGWDGGAGVVWQPSSRVRTGVAWKSGTSIHTDGVASGSASALFAALGIGANPAFNYHAQVETHLPQTFAAGVSWNTARRLRLSAEGDLTAWAQAFHSLPVTLTEGTNATIDSVVGSNSLQDAVPLDWRNQGAVHVGLEAPLGWAGRDAAGAGRMWTVRSGYSYMANPVPASTLTPLTAAILQQAVAVGGGLRHGRWNTDAAYQVQLPANAWVGQSGLLAGEYDNSHIRVWTQSVTLTSRVIF